VVEELRAAGLQILREQVGRAGLGRVEATSWRNRRASARMASAPGRVSSLSTRLLVTERVRKSPGRISAKRLLPAARGGVCGVGEELPPSGR
jgi:hypothetical protein